MICTTYFLTFFSELIPPTGIINMTIQEFQQEIVQYGASLSVFNPMNIDSGFLTMQRTTPLDNDKLIALSSETEQILIKFSDAFSSVTLEGYDSAKIFQYVFDKVVEVTYKVIFDMDLDTQFIPKEVYEYHEPDLPEYVQVKLTNVVGQILRIHSKTIDYIDKNGGRPNNQKDWLLPILLLASFIAMQFAQEIDYNDQSELDRLIKQ